MLKGNSRLAQLVILALAVPVVVALLVSPAMALGKPKAPYNNFTLCPVKNTKVKQCLWSNVTSGKVEIGKQPVPITNPITLQGGVYLTSEGDVFVPAEGGSTLSNSPQNVPGGLLGILPPEFLPEPLKAFFEEYIINDGPTGVTATTEQVGEIKLNEGNLLNGVETALVLPIRVHLNNTFLGSECYIGSSSHPITLNLTTGKTTGGPTGKPGTKKSKEDGGILEISGVSLVSNTFTAPKATGCGLLGLLDGIIDSKIGLPSASGKNVAVLNGKVEIANSELVEESEG